MEQKSTLASYGVVIAMFLLHAALQYAVYSPAAIATILMGQYELSATQFAAVSSMPYLTGFLLGIFSGAWADRWGIRKIMLIGMVVAVIGAVMRIFMISFIPLLIASFLLGFALAALNANSAKLIRLWFPGKGNGAAMGFYIFGATIGTSVVMSVAPAIGEAKQVFIVAAIVLAVGLVIWFFLGRTHPQEKELAAQETSIAKNITTCAKDKNIWIISIFMLALFGGVVTQNSFSNAALAELAGNALLAGNISSVNAIAVGIGGVLMPYLITKLKSLKPVIVISGICNFIWMIAILAMPLGSWTWFLAITQGIWVGVLLPMGKTLPSLLPGVDMSKMGAIGGFQSAFQNLGAWLVPAYIITPVVTAAFGGSYLMIYAFAGIFSIIAALAVLFLPRIGTTVGASEQA